MLLGDCQESTKRVTAPPKKRIQDSGVAAVLLGVVSSPAGVNATVAKEGKWAGSSGSPPCPTDSPVQKCRDGSGLRSVQEVQSTSDYGTTEMGTGKSAMQLRQRLEAKAPGPIAEGPR